MQHCGQRLQSSGRNVAATRTLSAATNPNMGSSERLWIAESGNCKMDVNTEELSFTLSSYVDVD